MSITIVGVPSFDLFNHFDDVLRCGPLKPFVKHVCTLRVGDPIAKVAQTSLPSCT